MEEEDDIKAILKCIWCCFKANSFTRKLLNPLWSKRSLLTQHNCCASRSLNYLKSYLEFMSRLPIQEFSGYHCMYRSIIFIQCCFLIIIYTFFSDNLSLSVLFGEKNKQNLEEMTSYYIVKTKKIILWRFVSFRDKIECFAAKTHSFIT